MARWPLIACTILATACGWWLGHLQPHRPVDAVAATTAKTAVAETPVSLPDAKKEAIERLLKEYDREGREPEFQAALLAEVEQLGGAELKELFGFLAGRRVGTLDPALALAGWWAERDIASAREWVLGVTASNDYATTVFDTWGRQDPAGMLAWVEAHDGELKTPQARTGVRLAVAHVGGRSDPERALRLLKDEPSTSWSKQTLYEYWAQRDAPAAAARGLQEADPLQRACGLDAVMRRWAWRDFPAAEAWTRTVADPTLAHTLQIALGTNLMESDPRAAAAYVNSQPHSNPAAAALGEILSQSWDKDYPGEAFIWAARVAEQSGDDWALERVLMGTELKRISTSVLPEELRAGTEKRLAIIAERRARMAKP